VASGLNEVRQTAVAARLDNPPVRIWEAGDAKGADAEDLANQYEFLVLYGVSIPAELDQKLREAHRKVHLRGLDPLHRPKAAD
jgi:hypothetical protein